MPPEVSQIVHPDAVQAMVADRVTSTTVVRDFFQQVDVPDSAGEEYQIPVPQDNLGEPEEVEPGADLTYDREDYARPVVERQIFKKGSKIPEEDINDNVFDLVEAHMTGHADKMAERLDRAAFEVLDAAAPSGEAVGDADGVLDFEDVNAGVTELATRSTPGEDSFTADMALVGPAARESITNYLADRGTDLGDETVQNGVIGDFGGITYAYSTNATVTGTDAIVVDTDHFGYEGEWQPVTTDQTTDFDSDSIKTKVKSAYGWVAARPEAAVRVTG